MADYWAVAVSVFIINIIPIFMPPTWIVLAFAKLNDPTFDPLMLTLVGSISSLLGRCVLFFTSSFFRRFFTKSLNENADDLKDLLSKKDLKLFAGTFLYSLGPFPSNLIFIAGGLSKIDPKPIFSGFFFGRLVSYYLLVAVSQSIFRLAHENGASRGTISTIFDILGLLAAVSIIFVDWKKLLGRKKQNLNK